MMLADPYVREELRRALGRRHLVLLGLGVAIAVIDAVVTPRLPDFALEFLRASLRLESMAELILVNDYLGQYFLVAVAGAFELLRVYVGPVEARELDLYLAKPIGRARFLAARSAPALASVLLLGAGLTVANALTLWPWLGGAALVPVLSAGLVITAVSVALLAALNLVFLRLREVEHAVLLAFAAIVAPLLPTSVLIYRPDVFEGPELSPALAFPASLLWGGGVTPGTAALALAAALAASVAFVALAARRLDRRPDV